jgi:hypothetical protein
VLVPRMKACIFLQGFLAFIASLLVDRIDPPRMPQPHCRLGRGALRRVLRTYAGYYNKIRTHRSLDKDAPISRPVQPTGSIKSHPILGGLHHYYGRV